MVVVSLSSNTLVSINVVITGRAQLVLGRETVQTDEPYRHVASQLGRLSLLPSVGW